MIGARPDQEVLWHDVECGSYVRDLPVWSELCAAAGSVLELGAGSGRVSLFLGHAGLEVTAIERDAALSAQITRRSELEGVPVTVLTGEMIGCDAGRRFDAVLAPMQLIQMIEPGQRPALLETVAGHLAPGGVAGFAIVEPSALRLADPSGSPDAKPAIDAQEPGPLPDVREADGWVYASRPLWVSIDDDQITVTRERQAVSPEGEIERSVHRDLLWSLDAARLETECRASGLDPVRRISLANAPAEADSTIVVVQAPNAQADTPDSGVETDRG